MARIFYIAKDKSGKQFQGYEEGTSSDELVSRLQAKDLIVIKISSEDKTPPSIKSKLAGREKPLLSFLDRANSADLVLFCRQLAVLLGAGVTILKSIEVVSEQVKKRSFYLVLRDLKSSMEQGLSFHEAIARHPKVFSELWVNLIQSGEASGNLAVVLDRLAKFLERNEEYKRKIVSALIYPLILLMAGMGALLFLTIKIIPSFGELFAGFNMTLPLITRLILDFSFFIRKFILVILGVLGAGLFLLRQYTRTESGHKKLESLQFKLPIFGDFFRAMIVERFSAEMATLVESGVPILYSLEITEQSVDSYIVRDYIRQLKEDVRQGKTLKEGLSRHVFFEPMVVQMVSIGEEIGELSQMLKRINIFYQEYVETFLTRFTLIFEPMVLIFMGVVIGIMVISIFLPIFKISQITG